ncbi:hypothetical protein Lser_V15G12297 [Lactuca serriola]
MRTPEEIAVSKLGPLRRRRLGLMIMGDLSVFLMVARLSRL